jgi:hypothetical protein
MGDTLAVTDADGRKVAPMNTRARRIIVSGLLASLLLVVVVVAAWDQLR